MSIPDHPLLAPPDRAGRSVAVRGALATGGGQTIRIVVQFVSVVVLARLMTPEDFGIFAMVVPIVSFATMFQDFGLSQALVTAPQLTQAQAAGMFRVNLALSILIATLLSLCAPLIVLFYGEPEVRWIVVAMAGQIVLAGATASHTALLSRGMKFNKLAMIEVAKSLAGFAVALSVALAYPGPWALASQTLAAAFIGMMMAWLMTGWRPVGSTSLESLRPLIRFGAGMTTFNLTNYLSRNADNVMIGWAHGATQLGLYDRAYKLLLYPLQQVNAPISNVMIPILSRMGEEAERYRAAYLRTLRQTLMLTVPGMVFLICTADTLIPALLGERWRPAVAIFQWLGIAGLHQTISNTFGWLFISQRRAGEYAKFGLFSTATCLAAFAAGLPWGAVGVAAAYALSGVFVRLPAIVWQVGRRGPVSSMDIVTLFAPYLGATAIAAGAWFALLRHAPLPPLLLLAASAALIFPVSWGMIALTRRGRETFLEAWQLLPLSVRRRFGAAK